MCLEFREFRDQNTQFFGDWYYYLTSHRILLLLSFNDEFLFFAGLQGERQLFLWPEERRRRRKEEEEEEGWDL